MLAAFGCATMVLARNDLLSGFDVEMKQHVKKSLIDKGVVIKCQSKILEIRKQADGSLIAKISFENEVAEGIFDTILFAIGRRTNVENLRLENAGVQLNGSKVMVDDYCMTNIGGIYAVGDVLHNKPDTAAAAELAGRRVARNLFGRTKEIVDLTFPPSTLLGPFEYSFAGVTEEAAQLRYGVERIQVYVGTYQPIEFIATKRVEMVHLKAIGLREGDKPVLGLHLFSPVAGEIIQGFAAAFRKGLTINDLQKLIEILPTISCQFSLLKVY